MQYRKFEEIVVEYPSPDLCIYPEYKGKPYFGIKYLENENHIIGYGTYNPKVLSNYLEKCFIPRWIPVTERLPNNSGRYLVSYDSGYVAMALYYESVSKWGSTKRIVAWMPLPESYKEDKE